MLKITRFVLPLIFILIVTSASGQGLECDESKALAQQFIIMGMITDVNEEFREWFVDPDWHKLPPVAQEKALRVFSRIRYKCEGKRDIILFDSQSGDEIIRYVGVDTNKVE